MKTCKWILIAALTLTGWSRTSAAEPAINYYSYGWFSTVGLYAIEYWVHAYRTDTPLISLRTQGYDESDDYWWSESAWGNLNYLTTHGWGVDILDGFCAGQIDVMDYSTTWHWDVEFSY